MGLSPGLSGTGKTRQADARSPRRPSQRTRAHPWQLSLSRGSETERRVFVGGTGSRTARTAARGPAPPLYKPPLTGLTRQTGSWLPHQTHRTCRHGPQIPVVLPAAAGGGRRLRGSVGRQRLRRRGPLRRRLGRRPLRRRRLGWRSLRRRRLGRRPTRGLGRLWPLSSLAGSPVLSATTQAHHATQHLQPHQVSPLPLLPSGNNFGLRHTRARLHIL